MVEGYEGDTWEVEQLDALYWAITRRMVYTYMLNELLKSGIKTPFKDGMVHKIRNMQAAANLQITNCVRRIDKGTRE